MSSVNGAMPLLDRFLDPLDLYGTEEPAAVRRYYTELYGVMSAIICSAYSK